MNGDCSEQELLLLMQQIAASEENQKALFNTKVLRAKEAYEHFSDEAHLDNAYRQLLWMWEKKQALAAGQTRPLRPLRIFVRYAAVVLLMLGLSFAAYFLFHTDTDTPPYITERIAPNGETKMLLLDDQTRIWLSAGSQLRYPSQFAKDKRTVELEGKAYFEVALDAGRPFTVQTAEYVVEVLGTAFEICSFGDERASDVILEKGSVCLSDKAGKALGRLHPGQIFEYDSDNRRFSIREIDARLYTSWRKGAIEFDRITFEELITVLERNYHMKIVLRSASLADYTFVSSLSLTKNIHEMMETLQYIVPMEYAFENDSVITIDAKKRAHYQKNTEQRNGKPVRQTQNKK